ncbi:hypothetical protein, partial [Variovorax sp. WS11]|uniref:hypothetical protein n=1 Tax=Variovorax sp. WS11 TaxID=1105204 RepID=UPI0015E6CAD8
RDGDDFIASISAPPSIGQSNGSVTVRQSTRDRSAEHWGSRIQVPVNVISHDFVKNETSQQIVKANGSVHGSQIKGAWPITW